MHAGLVLARGEGERLEQQHVDARWSRHVNSVSDRGDPPVAGRERAERLDQTRPMIWRPSSMIASPSSAVRLGKCT